VSLSTIKEKMKTAVVVPTLNAGPAWSSWIKALLASGVDAKDVYVIDSGSSDMTLLQSDNEGFHVRQIESGMFNHGGTRQLAVNDLAGYDLVIFLTQDAILSNPDSIKNLLSPFDVERVGAVCGRQLPRRSASQIESHARLYNYSSLSCTRSINDKNILGLKTAFLSNSFAAYRLSVLNEVGGFPQDIIFGEDMYVATKILKAGYEIAYAANACVYHSHAYSLWQEMKRYFDMGVFHAREPWIRQELGGAEGEGVRFVVSEINYLLRHAFWRIPEGLLRVTLRYAGFRLGLAECHIPLKIKRKISMNPGYFKIE